MEYLMTYGWAILVIVVVLAALLYLGVFNVPTPERCTLQTGLNCASFRLIGSSADLNISVTNGLPKEVTITDVSCTQQDTGAGSATYTTLTSAVVIPVGTTKYVSQLVDCRNGAGTAITSGTVGSAYVGKLYIKYYFTDEGSTATRVNPGDISLKYSP